MEKEGILSQKTIKILQNQYQKPINKRGKQSLENSQEIKTIYKLFDYYVL
jgi:hypothetical protein